ncbi:MAG: hypothetical protein HY038_08295 [Nitrospirae bacterium]|nr:hypothetical protein [Nitrospirota bacterium]
MTLLLSPAVVSAATGAAAPTNPGLTVLMLPVVAGTEAIVLDELAIPAFFGESVRAETLAEVSPAPVRGTLWAVPPTAEFIIPSDVPILAGDWVDFLRDFFLETSFARGAFTSPLCTAGIPSPPR